MSDLRKLVDEMVAASIAQALRPSTTAHMKVDDFFATWMEGRRKRRLASVNDDLGRYTLHVAPVLGGIACVDVRPRNIREIINGMLERHQWAPRTVRRVYALVSSMFRSMVAREVIPATPCVLEPGELPPDIDSESFIRSLHVFSRTEIELILTSSSLTMERRVLYACKALTGCRHGELRTLTFGQIEVAEPLGRIRLEKTKAKKPREVPIHPTLQWVLDSWRLRGWPELYGRQPTTDDRVLPDAGPAWKAQKQFLRDLVTLGLRKRRGHDLRRTMITMARVDGARDEVLRAITHGAKQDVQEQYTSWPWEVLCTELAKLRISVGGAAAAQLSFAFAPTSKQHAEPRAERVAK
jgi:integrase